MMLRLFTLFLLVSSLIAGTCAAGGEGVGLVAGRDVDSVKKLAALWESAKDTDPAVRQAAVRNLGELRDKAAVPVLTEVLASDQNEQVRLAALGALVVTDEKGAVGAYVKALNDTSEKVRQSAAQALAGLWDQQAQRALARALAGDESPRVRRAAAEALGTPGIMGRTSAHHWDGEMESEKALVEALISDTSYEVRATAARGLGGFHGGASLEPLIQALGQDENASVRAAAADSLSVMTGRPKAVDKLIDVLYFEKDDTVVLSAMRALKYTQDQRIVEPLVKALRSGNARIRWQAIDSLEGIRALSSIEGIREIADDPREADGIRGKAAEALEIIGSEY